MKFYHFTSVSYAETILSMGISRGHVKHGDGSIRNSVVWLTTDPDADGHGQTGGNPAAVMRAHRLAQAFAQRRQAGLAEGPHAGAFDEDILDLAVRRGLQDEAQARIDHAVVGRGDQRHGRQLHILEQRDQIGRGQRAWHDVFGDLPDFGGVVARLQNAVTADCRDGNKSQQNLQGDSMAEIHWVDVPV